MQLPWHWDRSSVAMYSSCLMVLTEWRILYPDSTNWQQVWPPTLSYHTYPPRLPAGSRYGLQLCHHTYLPRLYQLAAGMAPHFVISHLPTQTLPAGSRYGPLLCHITLTYPDSTSCQQVWPPLCHITLIPPDYQLAAGMAPHFVI